MSMQVNIPDDLASQLKKKAEDIGTDPEVIAVAAIRRQVEADEGLHQLLTPVREAFEESGMTEIEAVELFEKEKHAMRRECRESTS